jgi:hypothetical protein
MELAATAATYAWQEIAPRYDDFFLTLARREENDGE